MAARPSARHAVDAVRGIVARHFDAVVDVHLALRCLEADEKP